MSSKKPKSHIKSLYSLSRYDLLREKRWAKHILIYPRSFTPEKLELAKLKLRTIETLLLINP